MTDLKAKEDFTASPHYIQVWQKWDCKKLLKDTHTDTVSVVCTCICLSHTLVPVKGAVALEKNHKKFG